MSPIIAPQVGGSRPRASHGSPPDPWRPLASLPNASHDSCEANVGGMSRTTSWTGSRALGLPQPRIAASSHTTPLSGQAPTVETALVCGVARALVRSGALRMSDTFFPSDAVRSLIGGTALLEEMRVNLLARRPTAPLRLRTEMFQHAGANTDIARILRSALTHTNGEAGKVFALIQDACNCLYQNFMARERPCAKPATLAETLADVVGHVARRDDARVGRELLHLFA